LYLSLGAVLFYVYTGEITFASPSSTVKGTHKSVSEKELCFNASAKSVYLAADKVL